MLHLLFARKSGITLTNPSSGSFLEIKLVSKTDQAAKLWTKPELVKLGALKDVAGGAPVPTQNVNNS